MKMIAAADEEGGIGKNGEIPWHRPQDLRFFKFKTLHKNIVMGRKTFENIGILPNRKMYVLSKERNGYIEGSDRMARYVRIEQLFLEAFNSQNELYNCGGGEIYDMFLERIGEAFITRVAGSYDCDTFLPDLDSELEKISEFDLSGDLTVERWISSNKKLKT